MGIGSVCTSGTSNANAKQMILSTRPIIGGEFGEIGEVLIEG